MQINMIRAEAKDAATVSSILTKAARYLDSIDQTLWQCEDLSVESIAADVDAGLYFLAWAEGEAVGTLRFQLEDPMCWPDIQLGSSTFIHRLAIRRNAAGKGVSSRMLDWAKLTTRQLGRRFLRLDCAIRPKLCAVYEKNGFTKHSERQIGPYHVVRYEFDAEHYDQAGQYDG